MVAPFPQSIRNVGFLLTGAPSGDQSFAFGLKPEELSYSEPSRLTVQQTIGGAFADSFDRGVGQISISGTTGWRGTQTRSGEQMHAGLHDICFLAWHDARKEAVAQGSDPGSVQLYFTDDLDGVSVLVAPRSFTLQRSKSSPLLQRYQIQLLVLADADQPILVDDPIIRALTDPLRWLAAVSGLQNAIALIQSYAFAAQAVFGAVVGTVNAFIGFGLGLINTFVGIVVGTAGVITEAAFSVLSIGIIFAHAAANAFYVIADDLTLDAEALLSVQQLGAAWNDVACSFENGFDLIGEFPDYRAMRGASACSSTAGGDPPSLFTLQDVTPFAYIVPTAYPPVTVTPAAQQAMIGLQVDPLQLQGQQDAVYGMMGTVANGSVITPAGGTL